MIQSRLMPFLLCVLSFTAAAENTVPETCLKWPRLLQHSCKRLHQTWYDGNTDLYISGYAWHNRYTYSPEKIKTYNENAFGGGLGRNFIDEDGDMHGLYAFAFADSHKNFEPVAGYGFLKAWQPVADLRLGAGFTGLITARPDINKGIPFPGALPLVGITYKRATVFATYIPGAQGAGNVLYIFGKWQLTG